MSYLLGIIGLFVTLGLAYLIGSNKKQSNWLPNCDVRFTDCSWFRIITYNFWYSGCFCIWQKCLIVFLLFAGQGVDFVFAGVANKGSAPFFPY